MSKLRKKDLVTYIKKKIHLQQHETEFTKERLIQLYINEKNSSCSDSPENSQNATVI